MYVNTRFHMLFMRLPSVTVRHAHVNRDLFPPQSGESIMVEVAAGPSDSSTHEKVSLSSNSTTPISSEDEQADTNTDVCVFLQLPMVLKVPRLNSSPLALCDRPFSLLGFGDILVPGN